MVSIIKCSKFPARLSVVLFLFATRGCEGIGSWRKKSAASQDTKDGESTEKNHSSTSATNSYHRSSNSSDMNKTYLDLFGESAKDFLTRQLPERITFPPTDSECRWDWRYLRCEPFCECSLLLKIPGDFHLGRACRKRAHKKKSVEDIEDDKVVIDNELYLAYCSIENGGDGEQESNSTWWKQRTPPPPSVPSPLPFLSRTSKATWRTLKAKADPVVTKMTDELETIHSKVQDAVCHDLETRCSEDDKKGDDGEGDGSLSAPSLEVAWQERLFCRDMVRNCKLGAPKDEKNNND